MNDVLKNPVWASLQESHAKWKIPLGNVLFYDPEVCPFGAFKDPNHTETALNQYAQLTERFFLVSENQNPIWDTTKIRLIKKIEGCQMVLKQLIEPEIKECIQLLGEEYIDEIYNLIWLVMPGYYRRRSYEMGQYYGIFKDDTLVAISGQRMQTNDFIEISGVVTHPDYTRRGLASQLVVHTCREILKANKHPILHTTKGNPAIKLYEKLGFELTRDMNWWYFSRKSDKS